MRLKSLKGASQTGGKRLVNVRFLLDRTVDINAHEFQSLQISKTLRQAPSAGTSGENETPAFCMVQ